MHCICWAQSMDLDNPWIALLKAWIYALSGQSMDCPYITRNTYLRNSREWWLAKQLPHCLAQNLLNKQYPLVGRLQNPALSFWLMFSVKQSEGIQIINHQKQWTRISTIGCQPGHVDAYGSLYSGASYNGPSHQRTTSM